MTKDQVGILLHKVLTWSKNKAPDWFDDSFLHSMLIRHNEHIGGLTERQVEAVKRIAQKFQIK
jgi:hypothetical protein